MSRSRPSRLPGFSDALSGALEAHAKNLNGQGSGNLHRLVLSAVEDELVQFAVRKCDGNVSEAARLLGISRTTIARKLNGSADMVTKAAKTANGAKKAKPNKASGVKARQAARQATKRAAQKPRRTSARARR